MSRPDAILLDTCAIIWLAEGSLKPAAIDALDHAASAGGVFVSPVSAWEIGFLSNPRGGRQRLRGLGEPAQWLVEILDGPGVRLAPLTLAAALNAAYLPEPLHGDPADRLLIATAREMNVALATGDERILAYAEAGHVKILPC